MAIRIETTGSSWRNGCLASHTTEQVTSAQGQHKQLCPHHLVSGVVKAVMFLSDNKKKAPSLSCNIYYRWLEPWIAFELTQKQSPTSDRLHMAEYTLHLTALEKLSVLEIKWLRLPCQVSFSSRHWERAHSRAQESFVVWLESLGTLQKSYEKNCEGGWGLGASHLAQIPADGGCGLLQVLHRTVPCTRGISCLTDSGGTWHFHPISTHHESWPARWWLMAEKRWEWEVAGTGSPSLQSQGAACIYTRPEEAKENPEIVWNHQNELLILWFGIRYGWTEWMLDQNGGQLGPAGLFCLFMWGRSLIPSTGLHHWACPWW